VATTGLELGDAAARTGGGELLALADASRSRRQGRRPGRGRPEFGDHDRVLQLGLDQTERRR
jgi:hypothetical protein